MCLFQVHQQMGLLMGVPTAMDLMGIHPMIWEASMLNYHPPPHRMFFQGLIPMDLVVNEDQLSTTWSGAKVGKAC
jgi:hypothetical protein